MKNWAIIVLLVFGCMGCQRIGRKLFGVEDREVAKYVIEQPRQVVVQLSDQANQDFFRILIPELAKARYIAVKIGDGTGTWVPMPFTNPQTCMQATYVQDDRGMLTFYNIRSAVPFATEVRVEFVIDVVL